MGGRFSRKRAEKSQEQQQLQRDIRGQDEDFQDGQGILAGEFGHC